MFQVVIESKTNTETFQFLSTIIFYIFISLILEC